MKLLFKNKFHKTEAYINIKEEYISGEPDIISGLEYANYSRIDPYAKKKLKEIKNRLCGMTDCECGGWHTVGK